MQYPKITIVTPSFNQGHFIEQTITSVLDQGYPNLEYIIIDGGSKDNTVEVIKKYEQHLAYWVSEKDKGQSDAINKGMNRATGEVVNWLNSDDYYEKGTLKIIGKAFTDPALNVFCGISRIFGEDKEYFSSGTDIYPNDLAKTIGWARIDQPETFFRKSVWDKLGGLDQQFHYLMDRDLWVRYLLTYGLGQIKKTKDLLVHFRLHAGSKTVSQQDGFVKEGLNYYYTLAKNAGLDTEANIISSYRPSEYLTMKITDSTVDMRAVLHNFFWCQAADAYALDDWERFDHFSKAIDSKYLSEEDQKKLRRLIFRRKLLPAAVKKWWNKARSK
jgi:glycosyltransferase involved in cell wall biosynthesis